MTAPSRASTIRTLFDDSGVATLELCDAARRNTLSDGLVDELLTKLGAIAAWDALKVLVLVGGPDVFCAGASRELLEQFARGERHARELDLTRAILMFPLPVIAAAEGHALGGGLALLVAADIVLLARESRYGCPFMNLGFTPGLGLTRLLEYVVSPAVAHELLYTGEPVLGARLEGRSGFNAILPRRLVRAKAYDVAARIAEKPRPALEALKLTLGQRKRAMFEKSRAAEVLMHQVTFAQPDMLRMIQDGYVD